MACLPCCTRRVQGAWPGVPPGRLPPCYALSFASKASRTVGRNWVSERQKSGGEGQNGRCAQWSEAFDLVASRTHIQDVATGQGNVLARFGVADHEIARLGLDFRPICAAPSSAQFRLLRPNRPRGFRPAPWAKEFCPAPWARGSAPSPRAPSVERRRSALISHQFS